MRRSGRSRALLLAVPALALACGLDGTGEGRAPGSSAEAGLRVVVLDSVLLRESDSLYIGRSFGPPVVDPLDGSFYVSDAEGGRALRFARSGDPLTVYGRHGGGPGELRRVGAVFPVNDSIVAVHDTRDRALELFRRETGEPAGRLRDVGVVATGVLASGRRDTIWLAFTDFHLGEFSASMWVPGEDLFRHLWPVPRAYRDHPHYFATGPWAALARWGDAFLLGFGTLPNLYIADLTGPRGTYRDSLHVPALRRRAIPERERIIEIAETRSEAEKRSYISTLLYMFPRSDGSYLLIHADPYVEGEWPVVEIRSDYYLSVLSGDLEAACVDAPFEVVARARAAFASRGDTLFVLHERIVEGGGGEPGVERWVKLLAVEVDEDRCEWLGTAIPGNRR